MQRAGRGVAEGAGCYTGSAKKLHRAAVGKGVHESGLDGFSRRFLQRWVAFEKRNGYRSCVSRISTSGSVSAALSRMVRQRRRGIHGKGVNISDAKAIEASLNAVLNDGRDVFAECNRQNLRRESAGVYEH